MTQLLTIKDITKHYLNSQTKLNFKALDQVSFEIRPKEIIGLVGESGCGKTTLMKIIIGLEAQDQGHVFFQGQEIDHLLKKDRTQYYKNIQMIYQNPYDAFDPRYKIKEILLQPLRIHGLLKNRRQGMEYIVDQLEKSGFDQAITYLDRFPHELSGGQLQRIAILRSLLLEPKLVLADEPVSMLDVVIRSDILNLLASSQVDQDRSLVIVSHDILPLINFADRLVVMRSGRVVEIVETHNFFAEVLHPYTKLLMANAQGEEVESQEVQAWNEQLLTLSQGQSNGQLTEVGRQHWVRFETINY